MNPLTRTAAIALLLAAQSATGGPLPFDPSRAQITSLDLAPDRTEIAAGFGSGLAAFSGVTLPDIEVIPPTLDFGRLEVGDFAVETVLIGNPGLVELRVLSASLADESDAFELIQTDCGDVILGQGQSCSVTLRFDADAAGSFETELMIRSSAAGIESGVGVVGVTLVPVIFQDRFQSPP